MTSEERLDAAIRRLSEPGALREAESMVAGAAPRLQHVLGEALEAGGWFAESHEGEITRVATAEPEDDRIRAVRTLLAEEARLAMLVGVAVGWALHEELTDTDTRPTATPKQED
jgi:hypothetical protein